MIEERIRVFKTVLEQIPEIRYAGDVILRTVASPVSLVEGIKITKKLEAVLLKYRKLTGWGRGLAAPQIGDSRLVFITYVDNKVEAFINPKILETSSTTNFYRELCMSVGILAADVARPDWIIMEWTDENGKSRSERFDGFRARLYQHEEAHLRGHLNLDDATSGGIQFVNFDPLKEQLRDSQ